MNRDIRLFIDDILNAINKIEIYTEKISFENFKSDLKTVDAVIKNFIIIGEAVKQVPSEIRNFAPQIPWREMAGLRDKLVHGYFDIKLDVIWETVKTSLPLVKPLFSSLLKYLDEQSN